MIFSAEGRAMASQAEEYWIFKFLLRVFALVLCIVAIGVGAETWQYESSLAMLMVGLGLSIIWNLANIMVRLSRPRPMHPGANVGCDLIIWLVWIFVLVYAFFQSFNIGYGYSYRYGDGGYGYPTYSYDTSPRLQRLQGLALAAASISCGIGLIHAVLFVWACVDTHQRNAAKQDERAVIMASNIVRNMQARSQWIPGQPVPTGAPGMYVPYNNSVPQQQQQQYQGQWVPMHSVSASSGSTTTTGAGAGAPPTKGPASGDYAPYPGQQGQQQQQQQSLGGYYSPEVQLPANAQQQAAYQQYQQYQQYPQQQQQQQQRQSYPVAPGGVAASPPQQQQRASSSQNQASDAEAAAGAAVGPRTMLEKARAAWLDSNPGEKKKDKKKDKGKGKAKVEDEEKAEGEGQNKGK